MPTALHFAHANGFPARCYSRLLEDLGARQITFVERMGHGEWQASGDLWPLTDELIADIERHHDQPVVGLGHSTGGMMLMLAACRRPELFRDLILLDPMLLSAAKRLTLRLFRLVGLGDYLGPTRLALRRKSQYGPIEDVRQRLREKPLFRSFAPECFEDFLEHALVPTETGTEVAFRKEVEVAIFRSTQATVPPGLFDLQGLMVFGSHSHLLRPTDIRWWRRRLGGFDIEPFEGGHLFPFEAPQQVANLIRQRLAKLEQRSQG